LAEGGPSFMVERDVAERVAFSHVREKAALGATNDQKMEQVPTLTAIVRQHAGCVRAVLRRRGVPERDLADAEQEVFLVVHRKLAEFEGRSSLRTWLYRIAANVGSEHRRRARNRYERLDAVHAPEPSHSPVAWLETRESLERVRAALGSMSAEQREALLLHVAGVSMHEIAAQLEVPLKTAFSRIYAARKRLTAVLGDGGAAGMLSSVLALFGSSWTASRAYASLRHVARPHALSLQLVGVAMCCVAFVPQTAASSPIREATRTLASSAAVESAPSQLPARAAPAKAPAHEGVITKSRHRARRATRTTPAQPVPSPQVALTDCGDELLVTRVAESDPHPQLEHPLAARLGPTRTDVRAPRLGAGEGATTLDARLAEWR
jgi:RNA polymerase sigma-70 factor (ECF subfamily)